MLLGIYIYKLDRVKLDHVSLSVAAKRIRSLAIADLI